MDIEVHILFSYIEFGGMSPMYNIFVSSVDHDKATNRLKCQSGL